VSYYLVKTGKMDDRPEEVAEYIAHHLAVVFHAEMAARPWVVELDAPYLIETNPKAWARYTSSGPVPLPEEEEDVGEVRDVQGG
jgi:hypothetical protein